MSDHTITLTGITDDGATELVGEINKFLEEEVQLLQGSGFNGLEEVILMFSLMGEQNYAEALGNVISSWMQRNQHKSVEVDGVKISGYNTKDVIRLLEALKNER